MMFATLLAKELREQWRSWKLLIFVAVFLISGLASPVLAKYTPELLRSIPDMPEAFIAQIPTPTLADAMTQYIKNTTQFGVLLTILLTMGVVAQEKERGTAAMLLTKPVRRSAVVVAKWMAGLATILAGLLVGGLGCAAYTLVLFEALPLGSFVALNVLLGIYFTVYLSAALLASALARNQAVAAALSFGGLVVLLVWDALPRLSDYAPGKLAAWGSHVVVGNGQPAWPALAVALVLIVALVGLACLRLEHEEI